MSQSEFELFGWNTPNGQKIIIALEEIGVKYDYRAINISKGEQHAESFRRISPDGKIPALVHHTDSPVTLFESGAILLYLANLFPDLHGRTDQERAKVMAWTFWQVGQLGPLAGQFGRFQNATPANPAAVDHFEQLVWRCLEVMEKQLAKTTYLAGDHFSVADITSFTWVASEKSYLQIYGVDWRQSCSSIARWADLILQKASVQHAFNNN